MNLCIYEHLSVMIMEPCATCFWFSNSQPDLIQTERKKRGVSPNKLIGCDFHMLFGFTYISVAFW